MRARAVACALALAMLAGGAVRAAAADRWVLLVSGIGGEPAYSERFHRWSIALLDAVHGRLGIPDDHVTWLAETEQRDGARVSGVARREAVARALADFGRRTRARDLVLVFLVGHGTARDGHARFNLPGPDLDARDLAAMLDPLAGRTVVVFDTSEASGPFVGALSGPDRVVVTATASGAEDNATRFAEPMIAALAGNAADLDKDGRLSVLEVFEYARHGVAAAFAADGRLATEHALLDDDGDGVGSRTPSATAGDGVRAARIALADVVAGGPGAEARAALERAAIGLVDRVHALRERKAAMPPAEYERALEAALLDLARNRRAFREAGRR